MQSCYSVLWVSFKKCQLSSRFVNGDSHYILAIALPLIIAGIFCCYFYYGVVQEKITRGTYGAEKERYYYTMFLVFCQCIINALFAKGANSFKESKTFLTT